MSSRGPSRLAPALDAQGPTAPPRANGELVFAAPWESRVFGLTLALCEEGAFEWEEFRSLLIDEIGRWEASHADSGGHSDAPHYHYYERWLAAFERLAEAKGLCSIAQLDERAAAYAARPHGHDHEH